MLLHQARRGDRRGERRELERRQEAADDGGLGDGGDESQGSLVTPGAALHEKSRFIALTVDIHDQLLRSTGMWN